jgi:rhodanese-related sulfurtransferase
MKKRKSWLLFLLPLLLLAAVFSGCDYITGKALEEKVADTSPLPRWSWDGIVDGYSIVINRDTQQPLRDAAPEEVFGIIGTNQHSENPVVLDVRTPQEYTDGHISKALNIDVNSPDFKDSINKLDKNKTYIVYCRSGARSNTARSIMEESGFNHVINMKGGITDWISQGYPVEKIINMPKSSLNTTP